MPHDGAYRVLSGNEVGILANELLSWDVCSADFVNSIVSTTQLQKVLGRMALNSVNIDGLQMEGHAAAQHEARGGTSVMGFEGPWAILLGPWYGIRMASPPTALL